MLDPRRGGMAGATLLVGSIGAPPVADGGRGYRFCASQSCDVVYFAEAGGAIHGKEQLRLAVGIKETSGERPLCYCFGHSVASIKRELLVAGRSTAIEEICHKMRHLGCRCESVNPSGSCCLASVARGIQIALEELQ